MNHSVDIHNAKEVDVRVKKFDGFDVLKLTVKSGGERTEVSIYGGRWQVAPQTIRVMTDEEITAARLNED